MQSTFGFTNVEGITNDWLCILDPASTLKNNPEIDKSLKLTDTRLNKSRKSLET